MALAAFLLAAGLRLLNVASVMQDGLPRLTPFDDLYHLKRMSYSAEHFPHVLDPDPDRGLRPSFSPWPPMYDVAAGGLARLLGAASTVDVLRIVVWLPPLLFALFVAVLVFTLSRTMPVAAGIAGFAIATSAFTVTQSWFAGIDHHYLEPPLTFAILGAAILAVTGSEERGRPGRWLGGGSPQLRSRDGSGPAAGTAALHPTSGARVTQLLLAVAMTAALFVQTALFIACGLAFIILFIARPRAAVLPFGLTAAAIAVYRLTRPPEYPESAWFLGWTHAALLAGAAAAALIVILLEHARPPSIGLRICALTVGAGIALLPRAAAWSLLQGSGFIAGDRWLKTIDEFQPIVAARGASLVSFLVGLSGGALLCWLLAAMAIRRRDVRLLAVSLFAVVYLLLALSSRRFDVVAVPLLALAGAMYAEELWRRGSRRGFVFAALLVLIAPPAQLAAWLKYSPPDPIIAPTIPYFRAAEVLRRVNNHERVLALWSFGHLLDVAGGARVVIDNFGSMPDPITFERAHDALLQAHEAGVADFCRGAGIRYVLVVHPMRAIDQAAVIVGTDPNAYVHDGKPTRLTQHTWWWRAFFTSHPVMTHFRLIYAEPRLRIWRRMD